MPSFEEQKRTLDDCRRLLKEYGKCMLIRPTGFGKTWLLTELIKDYDKVLYLYPSQVVKDTVVDRYFDLPDADPEEPLDPETIEACKAVGDIPGCTLMTYAKLIRLTEEDINIMEYGLVIFDEAHRMGGAKTKIACEKLFAGLPRETRFIGATATPTRMDNFDVSSHYFSDRLCYAYTLHDAIEDGLIQKPNYCYATFDFRQDLEDAAQEAGEDLRDRHVQETISAKMIELGTLYNMPKIIREVCDKYAARTDYLKFIIFFASKAHMSEKLTEVESWFREAYPSHEVATLRISSASSEDQANTDRLAMLVPKPDRIDLVACIDMLNMGYHVSDQTGILMYRGTKSNTVFTQQLGRALSAGAGSSAIIFDIVDNLHRKAVYEIYVKDPAGPSKRARRQMEPKLDNYRLDRETGNVLMSTPEGEIATQYRYDGVSVKDRHGHKAPFRVDKNGTLHNTSDAMALNKDVNRLTPDCLNATGHEATYREILAKAMVEPLAHRCKYALQIHLKSWCGRRNIPYPIDDKKMTELYDLDIRDFYKEFGEAIKAKNIGYPLHDAEDLLRVDNSGDGLDAPLAVCCQATGASIQALLDLVLQS